MAAPEFNILDRTKTIIQTLAAERRFVASEKESVRSVAPVAVQIWKVPEGGRLVTTPNGFANMILPGILISPISATMQMGAGLNCADDEAVRIAVQIIDSTPHQYRGPIQTYLDWMDLIRTELLAIPNPFLQDADVNVYDPFVVHIISRLPADAKRLISHEQQVSLMVFQVMVRHHR